MLGIAKPSDVLELRDFMMHSVRSYFSNHLNTKVITSGGFRSREQVLFMNSKALSELFATSSRALERYRGKLVAIDVDTAEVVEACDDLFELLRKLEERGIDLGKVLIEYVPEEKVDMIV